MRSLPPLAAIFLPALLAAQNPQPAMRGLLVDCNPPRSWHTDQLVRIRHKVFDLDNRYYGWLAGRHLTYELHWQSNPPYLHFCQLPAAQAVAWSRVFHEGVTQDYVQSLWGTPSRASEKTWLYWMPNGWAQLTWEDGALAAIWIRGDVGEPRGELSRKVKNPFPAGSPFADKDTFAAMPAPQKPGAATAARTAAAPARTIQRAAAETIAPGAGRQDVLEKLGTPHQRSSIAGGDGVQETLTYRLEDGGIYRVRLLAGKVVTVQKN